MDYSGKIKGAINYLLGRPNGKSQAAYVEKDPETELFLKGFERTHPVHFSDESMTKEEREQLYKDIEETGERARLRDITNHGGCFPHPMPYFEEPLSARLRRILHISKDF